MHHQPQVLAAVTAPCDFIEICSQEKTNIVYFVLYSMKIATTIGAVIASAATCMAFTLSKATVSVGSQKIEIGEMNTLEIKLLPLSPQDIIKVDARLALSNSTRPHQISLLLSSIDNPSLAKHIIPEVSRTGVLSASIPVASIPEVLKLESKVSLKLIVADYNSKDNILKQLVELVPSSDLVSSAKYTAKPTLGHKDEIHHVFAPDPQTVGRFFPTIFAGLALALFAGLWVAWGSLLGPNLMGTFKLVAPTQLLFNVVFLCSLLGFEYTFVQYYLGQLIFTTLFYAFVLAFPSLFFGSRVLRGLSKDRALNKN